MNIKHVLSLVTGVVECLFFTGILFGWSSIRYVLEKEGFFSKLCELPSDNTTFPEVLNSNGSKILPTPFEVLNGTSSVSTIKELVTFNINSTASSYNARINNDLTEKSEIVFTEYVYPTCDSQSERLNLVFTIASTLLSFSTLINGYIYDTFGTWISRIIAVTLFTVGCILMTVSTVETSWLLFPAMSCFAVGGILMLVTNLQIGNLFGRMRSSAITMLSGALDSSSFVFLVFKIIYDEGVELTTLFHVTAWLTIFLWLRTFLLLPRFHIPFPVAKDYVYGLQDCKRNQDHDAAKEMKTVNDEEEIMNPQDEVMISPDDGNDDVRTFMYCVKSALFWTNVAHFSILQLRNYYFMNTLIDWLKPLTENDPDTLSSYLVAFGTCQLFGVLFAPMNGLLMDISSRLLLKKATVKEIVPLKSTLFSGVATSLLGTLFSLIIAIPSLPLQYVSFLLQVIFRSFLYGGNMSFIAIAFPSQHFGKLYGLTMAIGGLVSLLQYPLFTVVLRQGGGDFMVINVIFIFVSLLTLFHPANILMYCKKKEKEARKSSVPVEPN